MWPGAHRNIAHKTRVALALGKRRLHTKTSHYPNHKRGAEGHLITRYTIIITSHYQNSTTLCRIKSTVLLQQTTATIVCFLSHSSSKPRFTLFSICTRLPTDASAGIIERLLLVSNKLHRIQFRKQKQRMSGGGRVA